MGFTTTLRQQAGDIVVGTKNSLMHCTVAELLVLDLTTAVA
jgi:hypothetical protein